MNAKVKMVVNGFFTLSESERAEAVTEFNKFINGTPDVRESLRKSLSESTGTDLVKKSQASVNFGPAPGGCPCCGR